MKLWTLALTLLLPAQLRAQEAWQLTPQAPAQPLAHCQVSRQVSYQVSGPLSTRLHLLVIDPKEVEWKLVDQPERSLATTVKELSQRHGAIAGVNGGYFTLDNEPLGFFKNPELTFGEISPSSLVGGFFTLKKGVPKLLWRPEFKQASLYHSVMQVGPRLISDSKATRGLEAKKKRPRTFVAETAEGLWIVGNTPKMTLQGLAELLSQPKLLENLTITRALNFDGGRSAAMYWKDRTDKAHAIEEVVIVRNALLLLPKKS